MELGEISGEIEGVNGTFSHTLPAFNWRINVCVCVCVHACFSTLVSCSHIDSYLVSFMMILSQV